MIAATLVATALRLGTEPGVFAPFLVAVVATALHRGAVAGLVALAASVGVTYVCFFAPLMTLAFDPDGLLRLTLFRLGVLTAAGLAIVLIAARSRRELETLQRSRRQLKSFIADDTVGLQVVDLGGTVTWADRAALELLGYETGEHIGSHVSLFHADPAVLEGVLARIAAGQPIENLPARLRRKDGSTVDVLLNSNALLSDPGTPGAGVLLALLPVVEAVPALDTRRPADTDARALIASVLERRRRTHGAS